VENKEINICAAIVLFNSDYEQINNIITSLINVKIKIQVYLIDNSPTDEIKHKLINRLNVTYIFTGKNIGFGKAHNIAIAESLKRAKYHLILNPDVYFEPSVVEQLFLFMEGRTDVGICAPKILYPNKTLQYSCRLLPGIPEFLCRRFSFLAKAFRYNEDTYFLKFTQYKSLMEVPFLLGCFLFINNRVLEEVGGFDERFFMYMEDFDLCRRIGEKKLLMFIPSVSVIHNYERGSAKKLKLLKYHILSGIKYFAKWGINDKGRIEINNRILRKLKFEN
jgi:GT2 family glycosyltransferase